MNSDPEAYYIFLHLQFIFLTNLTTPKGDKVLYLLPIFIWYILVTLTICKKKSFFKK